MTAPSENNVTYIAQTNYRNVRKAFGIKQADRRSHMYIIGKTGTGKSTLLEMMIRQDMANGQGLALLDPHGDLVESVLRNVPESRINDLIYFNVPDTRNILSFNPLEHVPIEKRGLAASGLLEAFKKIWADSWGPRLEHILRNAFLALLDQREATLGDVLRLLNDRDYRRTAAGRIYSLPVRDFWLREYESYPAHFRAEAIAPIQNKVGAFLANPLLNRILGQPKSSFDVRRAMDEGKILLVNLAKGKIGEDAAMLLGSLLVSSMGVAALGRAELPEMKRKDFFLYLDEFQNFTTLSLASMLSELRKYRVGLILTHQYLNQVDQQVRESVLANAGTIVSFRVGVSDAEILEKELYPHFSLRDLINLPNYSVYLKLMIGGVVSPPFSAKTQLP